MADIDSGSELNTLSGNEGLETDASYAGKPTAQTAAKEGVTIPKFDKQKRDVESNGVHLPSNGQVNGIVEANKMTGGGAQAAAGNVAQNALSKGGGQGGGKFDENGNPLNPRVPYTERDLDITARTIYGEARGESLKGKIMVAENIINRTQAHRAGKFGPAGNNMADTALKSQQYSAWNSDDPNRSKMLALSTNDPEYKKARQAAMIALAGTNYTNGSLYYATNPTKRPYQGQVSAREGSHTYYLGRAEGGWRDPNMDQGFLSGNDSPEGIGDAIQNNIRMDNAAKVMSKGGYTPTVSEAAVVSSKGYSPKVAQTWGDVMSKKRSHMSISEIIKKHPEHKQGLEELIQKFSNKTGGEHSAPIELKKTWMASLFKPFQGLANQKWRPLNLNKSFNIAQAISDPLGSLISDELVEMTSALNSFGITVGRDGPDASGIHEILAKIHEFTGSGTDYAGQSFEEIAEDIAEDLGIDNFLNLGESSNY